MISIQPLTAFLITHRQSFGHNGYTSDQVYRVIQHDTPESTSITFQLEDLPAPFVKTWDDDPEDFTGYAELLPEGHSFGACDNGTLTGVVICEERTWNNTLFITLLQVAAIARGKGIGTLLLQHLITHAAAKGFRLLELETQNTNVPAIRFYRQQGFRITGCNTLLYDGLDETAIYMTRQLRLAK